MFAGNQSELCSALSRNYSCPQSAVPHRRQCSLPDAAVRGFHGRGWLQIHDWAVIVTQASALSRFAGSWLSPS
jgi:hypothetical protein